MEWCSTESSKAIDIEKEILSTVSDTNSLQTLAAVVCDGTVNNTGKWGGVVRSLEEGVGTSEGHCSGWSACCMKTNYLSGSTCLSLMAGVQQVLLVHQVMALNFDPKDLPIVKFKPVDGKVIDVSDDVMADLSIDQYTF